jgi:hypothetical protein
MVVLAAFRTVGSSGSAKMIATHNLLSGHLQPAEYDHRRPAWGMAPDHAALAIAPIAITGIAIHLLLRFAFGAAPQVFLVPLYVVLLLGGLPLLFGLIRRIVARNFGSDLLAGVSILTSVLQGEYLVGTIVVLMLSGGTALEQYTSRRASRILDTLANRMPQTTHRKVGGTDCGHNLEPGRGWRLAVHLPPRGLPGRWSGDRRPRQDERGFSDRRTVRSVESPRFQGHLGGAEWRNRADG